MRLLNVFEDGDRVHVTTPEASGEGYVGWRPGTLDGHYQIQLDDTRYVEAKPQQMRLIRPGRQR